MNPYDFKQKLTFTYMTPSRDPIEEIYEIDAMTRKTIKVDDVPGLEAMDVSTRVSASAADMAAAHCGGVVVERAMYFTYVDPLDGSRKAGGSCSIGYGSW